MKRNGLLRMAMVMACICTVGTQSGMAVGAQVFAAEAAEKAAPLSSEEKLAELTFFCSELEKLHPDMYRNVSKEAFLEKRTALEQKVPGLSDREFAYELQMLAALLGDAHTSVSLGNETDGEYLPVQFRKFGEKWICIAVTPKYSDLLGKEVVAIGGTPMEEAVDKLAPLVSYETDSRLTRQLRNILIRADLLAYMGVIEGAEKADVTFLGSNGQRKTVSFPSCKLKEYPELSSLSARIAKPPVTKVNKSKLYFSLELEADTLYIQYNSCRQDKNLPMEVFAGQIAEQMQEKQYKKVIIDLRNNSGGSDGVLIPLIQTLLELEETYEFDSYALIGEATFSSAVINAAMLKEAGFTLVGTPTGNLANHFGQVSSFTLPHSGLEVWHSNKWIDLTTILPSAKQYGDGPIVPDVYAEETLESYLAGEDAAVKAVLDGKGKI